MNQKCNCYNRTDSETEFVYKGGDLGLGFKDICLECYPSTAGPYAKCAIGCLRRG